MNKGITCDVKEFIRTYQEADSMQEVAQKLGAEIRQVYSKANYLRTMGVNLKPLKRVRQPDHDYGELNDYAQALTKKHSKRRNV